MKKFLLLLVSILLMAFGTAKAEMVLIMTNGSSNWYEMRGNYGTLQELYKACYDQMKKALQNEANTQYACGREPDAEYANGVGQKVGGVVCGLE